MRTYSMEFRIEVAAAYDQCGSSIEVAEEKGCSESWVRRLIQQRTATGSLAPKRPDRSAREDARMAIKDGGRVG